ncbi:hypothetical protein [uncultured Brevundimonas sp.]|uniref:hypothetical protein n=1 Tax=uncultured Brevundimonas sp. TaxID=213418 RepID=UPI0030ED69E3|tara:strand:+ start:36197 stop:36367 length:171 start_codon:yes stop_codon:yes gene_type:complete
MFDKFQRRNNRKARLSHWFASERDSDLHAFDVVGVASRVGALVVAVLRKGSSRNRS